VVTVFFMIVSLRWDGAFSTAGEEYGEDFS
jgi:hypothetical protein